MPGLRSKMLTFGRVKGVAAMGNDVSIESATRMLAAEKVLRR